MTLLRTKSDRKLKNAITALLNGQAEPQVRLKHRGERLILECATGAAAQWVLDYIASLQQEGRAHCPLQVTASEGGVDEVIEINWGPLVRHRKWREQASRMAVRQHVGMFAQELLECARGR